MHRLITLGFSHYNEKARWALERCGVPFDEERHMPGFSSAAVALATRGRGGRADRASSKFSTPYMICDDGRALSDSTDIARFASSHAEHSLFPTPEVDELVTRFSDRLGPYTRYAAYFHAIRHERLLPDLAHRNVSAREARLFCAIYPIARRSLARSLGLSSDGMERAIEKVDTELDFAVSQLGTSDFLVGDTFTAADLTFAAMMAPVLLITPQEGYGGELPRLDELDAEAQQMVHRYRAHPAGQFAARIYAAHRR